MCSRNGYMIDSDALNFQRFFSVPLNYQTKPLNKLIFWCKKFLYSLVALIQLKSENMFKRLLVAGFILMGLTTTASHMKGGEITWKKTSSGQFIFELRVYRECGTGAASFPPTQIISGPNGNINLSRDTAYSVNPNCTGPGQIVCNVLGYGGTEVHVYRSSPISLQGTPPTSGWKFTHTACCRAAGVVNLTNSGGSSFYLESVMYPGAAASSPKFAAHPNEILTNYNKTYNAGAISPNPGDSLHHVLVNVRTSASGAAAYAVGYNGASPFPNSSTNAANGSISIDANTGLVTYDIQLGVNGSYAFAVAVEQWRNGIKIGRIYRDFLVTYNNGSASNSAPSVSIDTAQYQNITQTSSEAYEVIVSPGDTLDFRMHGSDFDNIPSNMLPQVISFDAKGRSLDVSYTASGIANGAKLNPVAPQTGFSQAINNNIQFSWPIDVSHLQNPYHFFTFSFKDDQCPAPGISFVTLKVIVKKAAHILADTMAVCAGDSVQLKGHTDNNTYQWSPAAGLSDPSVKNPMAAPSSSGYYYLSNGSGDMDSVYVHVTQPGSIDLAFTNGKLELTDTNATTNKTWYYNGVPFYYPHDTLTPFGFGDYWVKASQEACGLVSDTVNINTSHSFSVIDPTNGGYFGTALPQAGSHGFTFSINQNVNVNSITIIGVEDLHKRSAGYDLNVKMYDDTQTEVFNKDVTLTPPFYGPLTIPVGYNITANSDYTLAISGDTAYSFKFYESTSYPATPHQNGIKLKGAYEGLNRQFPTQPTNYLMPVSFNTDVQTVGISEAAVSEIEIYPNPVADRFTIMGLRGSTTVELMNVSGKVIAQYSTKEGTIEVGRGDLASGVYFIKVSGEKGHSIHKVFFN